MHASPSLFDKYGGIPAVRRLVKQFHERFAASPTLRRYFENVDTEKFIQHHAELIAYTLGKPAVSFDPNKMSEQHHPHDISLSSFEKVVDILRQVLLDAKFEGGDIAQILHRLHQQRHRIVPDTTPLNHVYQPEHTDDMTGSGDGARLLRCDGSVCGEFGRHRTRCARPYGRRRQTDYCGLAESDQGRSLYAVAIAFCWPPISEMNAINEGQK